ncbi:hypothetical protein ACIP5Y_37655 [Nocardia sp. NPDC088792]|uniref:hypothetical protein n=1 Tax=Nocardia sp. NPDC088792 TaxID=3364332 RepID=UPI003830974F
MSTCAEHEMRMGRHARAVRFAAKTTIAIIVTQQLITSQPWMPRDLAGIEQRLYASVRSDRAEVCQLYDIAKLCR